MMHLPRIIPSCKFWSVILYEKLTGMIILTDQPWPSVHSNCKGLDVNTDGSVDIWFGPVNNAGEKQNFIKTNPGKNWLMIMRLYDLTKPVEDNEWKPGGIEEVIIDPK